MRQNYLKTFIFLSIILALTSLYYGLCTESAASLFGRYFITQRFQAEQITVEKISGTILKGIFFKNVEIKNSQWIATKHVLRIQDLTLDLNLLTPPFKVKIENARLILSQEEPIIFSGNYYGGTLNLDLYSTSLDLANILNLFPKKSAFWEKTTGAMESIQLQISGSVTHPHLEGTMLVKKFTSKNFSLFDVPLRVSLDISKEPNFLKIKGGLYCEKGLLKARDSEITLSKSNIVFLEQPGSSPSLFVNGTSVIDTTKINISLRGSMKNPILKLTSDPPLSQDRLLVMLATNKSWNSLENSLGQINKNEISSDMVKDFFDYAFLGGSGEKMAQKLGIKDGWVKMDQNTRSAGIKKSLSDALDVGCEVEEIKNTDKTKDIKYKMLGDLKVTDCVTVSVEKELKKEPVPGEQIQPNLPDDKIFIKYKNNF
ncbi:MAG: translocation/assembly module TamB domain-containing protein [Candidatus Omnitrophica bacterium]|nr:translocation/assembly module TamB domain-containing protein [Candidatus Omnitrophota bacterium]